MKKILLINPIIRSWAKPNVFPTGLGLVAANLRRKGYQVEIEDLNVHRTIDDRICHVSKPDAIGITGIITQYTEVKSLTEYYKNIWPDVPIICGGLLATTIPQLLLQKTKVDICVVGEGDFWEPDFEILNDPICFMSTIKDISFLPYPAYDLFPIEVYINNPIAADNIRKWQDGEGTGLRSLNIIGSRGCPFSCVYCAHNFIDQGYRIRSYNDIIMEMDFLYRKYNIDYIHFTDDAFACNKKFIENFCRAFKGRKMKWSCAGRVNMVDEVIISKMAEAGCIGLCYGLESGSQRMLNIMNKKATIEQYEQAIRLNKKYFSYEDYTFIVGTPGENSETIQESIDFCKRNEIIPTAVFYMTPYPGTPLFNELVITGKIDDQDMDYMDMFVSSLGEQGEQMVWNFTDQLDKVVMEWHNKLIEETGAWNKTKHKIK